jgi:hypothetical protein
MQQFYLLGLFFCFFELTNESFIEKFLLPKTEANKIELKNIKYLYACYPEDSEICGRAKNALRKIFCEKFHPKTVLIAMTR